MKSKKYSKIQKRNIFGQPWVIGVGTTVIGGVIVGLILYFCFGIGKSEPGSQPTKLPTTPSPVFQQIQQTTTPTHTATSTTQQGQQPTIPTATTKTMQLSKISPNDIMQSIENLPPFQQNTARQNYKGVTVSWNVNLYSVIEYPGGCWVAADSIDESSTLIFIEVKIDDYPQLKIAQKGQAFTVQGTIDSVELLSISLVNCQLYFP